MLTMTTAGHNRRVFRVELFESENIFFKRSGGQDVCKLEVLEKKRSIN